jgi:uncharacterized protein YfaS (alpha-2-macroglobulin family)
MKKTTLLLSVIVGLLVTFSCNKKSDELDNLYKFREYIAYHTTGRISKADPIQIQLNKPTEKFELTQELPSDFISISPQVKGKLILENQQTLYFIPDAYLNPNTEYTLTLQLDKLWDDIDKEFRKFTFSFQTLEPNFKIQVKDLQSYSRDWQMLTGELITSDVIDSGQVNKLLTVTQEGKKSLLKWESYSADSKLFRFTIDSIQRFEEDSEILLSWDGSPIQSPTQGNSSFTIPGKSNFSVVSIAATASPNAALKINFSDPVEENQNFNGLVSIQNSDDLRFEIDGNLLTVYPQNRVVGDVLVEIFQGIRSVDGYKMKKNFTEYVSFEQLKPQVRLVSQGVIIPDALNTPFYFEAVNLSQVEVRVIKIFQDNILQFLQTSNLNHTYPYEIKRVGRRVAKKTIDLMGENQPNDGQWKAYALNLSELFKADPGAMYQIEISFKPEFSLYDCSSETTVPLPEEEDYYDDYYEEDYYYADATGDEEEREQKYWDNKIYNWRKYTYNWQQYDNPCHPAYYNEDRIVRANLLASNLGFIVKKGNNHSYHFATSNILTSNPEGGVHITLYNYQKQPIGNTTTLANGLAIFDAQQEAAFAVAKKGNNYSYLSLSDGNALSLSSFDVAGKKIEKGLKGFLYTERGVHRPGDTIHLTMVLNDQSNPLPKNHPVTLEVTDARGKLVHRKVLHKNESQQALDGSLANFYYFPIATHPGAPTGNWTATVLVGGASFSKNLSVATVKPNRLKINLDFPDTVLDANQLIQSTAQVNWLHGAPARNLNIEMQATLRFSGGGFKNHPNYVFEDPVRSFTETEIPFYTGTLNADGKVSISKKLDVNKKAPGMLRANFLTKVFEGGGDFSIDVHSVDLAPFSHFVGLQSPKSKAYGSYFTDENIPFDVITVNSEGKVAGQRELQVQIFRIEWRWWWNRGSDNLSAYENATYHRPVQDFKITTNNQGKGSFQVKIPDEESGRYLIRVIDPESGHATGRVAYFYKNWWSSLSSVDAESAKMLVFAADKEKYQVGEEAVISFPSSSDGYALLSIENGIEVLETMWIATQKGETQTKLKISELMAPNVYVNISLLQPHSQTVNDMPIRLYGVIPLTVENPNTLLQPEIAMPEVLKPESSFTVQVSEKNKKAMTYTLAVVDEGLLDLTRFKTPDIHSAFYTREALGVKTFDIYDYVIGAYSGSVNNIYAIGGGDEAAGAKNRKADRFKPVVKFLGPFYLKTGEKASHTIDMPNYIGSVKTMVIAGDNNQGAYGNAEKITPVRKPLMVLASLPRKLSPGEKVTLPVTVFAMENKIKNVSVSVSTSPAIKALNGTHKTINFNSPGEEIVLFEYEVQNQPGIQTIEVVATAGGEKATYQVEIDVENPNPISQKVTAYTLQPGEELAVNFDTFGESNTNHTILEVSTLPAMDYNKRMEYLIRYPHGCLEQITSGAFPQLYLSDIFDITNDKKQQIQKNVEAVIRRINTYQNTDGGLGYWPGERKADEWSTNYAGHFMLEAKNKGYVLPVTFLSNWIRFQQNAARQWRNTHSASQLTQAYRLYTLALAGHPELAAMNRLRETPKLSNDTKWRLAAAYALAGQEKTAREIMQTATIDFQPVINDYHTYGSPFRNQALALETMVLLQDNRQVKIAEAIAQELSSDRWFSTQETAVALLALSKMVEKNGGKAIDIVIKQSGSNTTVKTTRAMAQRDIPTRAGNNNFSIKNNQNNVVFVRLIQHGQLPLGEELSESQNLQIITNFLDGEGKPIDITSLRQGTEVTVQVRVTNTTSSAVRNIALTQLIPSGWEIINTTFTELGGGASGQARYTDLRDDRVYYYFDLAARETQTFTLRANASYLGTYYLPGTQAEAMYNGQYFVRNKGRWVHVIQ